MSGPLAARLRKYSHKVVAEIMRTYYVGVLFAESVLSEEDKEELEDLKTTRIKQAKRFVETTRGRVVSRNSSKSSRRLKINNRKFTTSYTPKKRHRKKKMAVKYRVKPELKQHLQKCGQRKGVGTPTRTRK